MSQPTPSTAVNTLVELASNVANKQAEPEALHQVLNQRLEMLLASREDFERKAEAMGEAFTIPHAELIDRVQEHYDQYEQSLHSMLAYFESGNPADLHKGSQALIDVTVPMTETVQEYVKALVSFGPSPYTLLNAANNILRSIVTQGVPPEALNGLIEETVTNNIKALAEIDASPYGKQEGYQKKRTAIVALTDAVQALKPVASVEEIDGVVAPLQVALEQLTAADQKILEENVASSPTQMPAANVLINTARGVLNGTYSLEVMEDALRWYKEFLEVVEEQFNAAVEGETDSVVILEELPKTREIIDQHDEVIADLEEALEDFTAENVEPILEELIDVIERLKDSSEVYMDVAKREGKLVCVGCGHPNPPTNRSCEECGQRLPQLVDPNMYAKSTLELEERTGLGGDEPAGGVVTENTYKLFEACEKFFAQSISEAEFRKVLNWSREQVEISERKTKNIKEFKIDEETLAEGTPEEIELLEENIKLFNDTKHLYQEGVDDWVEGLDLMEDFIETRHRPTLELGIQKVWGASQKLHSLQKIGDLAKRALDEREAMELAKAQANAEPSNVTEVESDDDAPPEFEQQDYVQGEGGLA
jgi:hypothetical protein